MLLLYNISPAIFTSRLYNTDFPTGTATKKTNEPVTLGDTQKLTVPFGNPDTIPRRYSVINTGLQSLQHSESDSVPLQVLPSKTESRDTNGITKTSNTLSPRRTKWKLGFTAFAGWSDNVSGFPFVTTEKAYQDLASIPSPSGGISNPLPALSYSAGFAYGLGAFVQTRVGNKLHFSLGLQYQNLSTQSTVGTNTSFQSGFYDLMQNRVIAANDIYTSGTNTVFHNSYRSLSLPLDLVFTPGKSPFSFTAGLTPAVNIGSRALIENYPGNVYIVSRRQFSNLGLAAQVGFSYSFLKTKFFNVGAGPIVQYGLSNVTTGTGSQHLFFSGFKSNFSFK